jgi:hypothetical protein
MGAMSPAVSRVCGFVAGAFVLAMSAGCAGSSSSQSESVTRTGAVQDAAQVLTGGSGHTSIRGVRIDWQRDRDGRVCYAAKLPPHDTSSTLASCSRHLRANEIGYAIERRRKTRQLVIVGLKGPRVAKVYVRFPAKRWTPPASRGAFFGYIPRGKVVSVVKVLKNGTHRAFAVSLYSA